MPVYHGWTEITQTSGNTDVCYCSHMSSTMSLNIPTQRLPPMVFHSCTSSVDIAMTPAMCNMLRERSEDRPQNQAFIFDAWMHQQIRVGLTEEFSTV